MSIDPVALCDRPLLARFLADQLSEEEQQRLEQHLDQCPACCDELENLAADGGLWRDVRQNLSSQLQLVGPASTNIVAVGDTPQNPTPRGDNEDSLTKLVLGFLSPTDDPRMMGRLGSYEIAGIVGYGGMGIVLKGFDASLNRYAAVKVLAPHLATSGAAKRRFHREAKAAAAVVHDNVIEIFGVHEVCGLPFLAMPYVRGTSLERRIRDEGVLELDEILRIAVQTAAGLAAAHAQGLVHRDVKPANILLADEVERVKLTDFGLARAVDDASLTQSGVISGTPQYMSPEQARGEGVDARSDLFSLGSVIYVMCTGRPPFRAETAYGILRRVTDNAPRPIREINPAIPDWLEAIVDKLHAKQADQRFASADELSKLLEDCLAHVQQPTKVELPKAVAALVVTGPKKAWWLNRSLMGAAAAAVLVLLSLPFVPRQQAPTEHEASASASTGLRAEEEGPRENALPAMPVSDMNVDWNDGVDGRIDEVEAAVDLADREIGDFWNDSTPPVPPPVVPAVSNQVEEFNQ